LTVKGSDPAVNAAGIDAEEVGYLLDAVPLAEALHREKPPMLQFSG
jgi:hypothetical protein